MQSHGAAAGAQSEFADGISYRISSRISYRISYRMYALSSEDILLGYLLRISYRISYRISSELILTYPGELSRKIILTYPYVADKSG